MRPLDLLCTEKRRKGEERSRLHPAKRRKETVQQYSKRSLRLLGTRGERKREGRIGYLHSLRGGGRGRMNSETELRGGGGKKESRNYDQRGGREKESPFKRI